MKLAIFLHLEFCQTVETEKEVDKSEDKTQAPTFLAENKTLSLLTQAHKTTMMKNIYLVCTGKT